MLFLDGQAVAEECLEEAYAWAIGAPAPVANNGNGTQYHEVVPPGGSTSAGKARPTSNEARLYVRRSSSMRDKECPMRWRIG